MKEFEKAKEEYDNITIPKELSRRVAIEIEYAEEKRKHQKAWAASFRKCSAAAAAILMAVFVTGLNISPVFAKEMENIPVIGELAKVLTFRTYEVKTEDYVIKVEIPTIEIINEDFAELEESVNTEIYELCGRFALESEKNALEYRKAFLETGGTLKEWQEHDIKIKVWYEVQLQTEEYLSLLIKRTESWNSAGAGSQRFNINLITGELVSTEEIMEATGLTYYEDNFTVDTEAAAAYAEKIKAAVLNKNLEALADLTAYPVYVGLDKGLIIESKEAFTALEPADVFTEELVKSIADADVSSLLPSRAGFYISAGNGAPSITFGVVDGVLKIVGINY